MFQLQLNTDINVVGRMQEYRKCILYVFTGYKLRNRTIYRAKLLYFIKSLWHKVRTLSIQNTLSIQIEWYVSNPGLVIVMDYFYKHYPSFPGFSLTSADVMWVPCIRRCTPRGKCLQEMNYIMYINWPFQPIRAQRLILRSVSIPKLKRGKICNHIT